MQEDRPRLMNPVIKGLFKVVGVGMVFVTIYLINQEFPYILYSYYNDPQETFFINLREFMLLPVGFLLVGCLFWQNEGSSKGTGILPRN